MAGDNPAVEALLQAFKNREWQVREAATQSLLQLGRPAADQLVRRLAETDDAARALVAMGAAAAASLAACAARTEQTSHAWKAANVLVSIGQPALVSLLTELGAEPAPVHAEVLVFALGEIGVQQGAQAEVTVVPALADALVRHGHNARMMAAKALEKNAQHARPALPALIAALQETVRRRRPAEGEGERPKLPGDRLREQVEAALVKVGPPAVPALLDALKRPDAATREGGILRVLDGIRNADPSLGAMLKERLDRAQQARIGLAPPEPAQPSGAATAEGAAAPVSAAQSAAPLRREPEEASPAGGGGRRVLPVLGLVLLAIVVGGFLFHREIVELVMRFLEMVSR